MLYALPVWCAGLTVLQHLLHFQVLCLQPLMLPNAAKQ